MDLLNWRIPYMDNTHSSWLSLILILIVLFRSKDIHGAVRPIQIQIFTTKKYWILFRIGPERRRRAGMPTGVYYWIHPTREYPFWVGNVWCQSHWMGKSPIPKTDYVLYFIRWVAGGHFTRGFYCINLPLCDSCWSIYYTRGGVQGGRFQNGLPFNKRSQKSCLEEDSNLHAL